MTHVSEPGPLPRISVRSLQRTLAVSVIDLEEFAARALRGCMQLHKRKSANLTGLHEIFVWLVSDRRMATLHRQFLNQKGPTDVLTVQHCTRPSAFARLRRSNASRRAEDGGSAGENSATTS